MFDKKNVIDLINDDEIEKASDMLIEWSAKVGTEDPLLSDKLAFSAYRMSNMSEYGSLKKDLDDKVKLQNEIYSARSNIEKNHVEYNDLLITIEGFFNWFIENTVSMSRRCMSSQREKELHPFIGKSLSDVIKLSYEERKHSYNKMLEQLEQLKLMMVEPEMLSFLTTGKYIKRGKFYDFTNHIKKSEDIRFQIEKLTHLDTELYELEEELENISRQLGSYWFSLDDQKNKIVNVINSIIT